MSYSPEGDRDIDSPEIFMSNVRCNLDSQFLNARDSIRSQNICVYARVRPMLAHETAKGFKECLAAIDEQTVRVVVPVTSSKYKSSRQGDEIIEDYTFTAAFGPETGQFVFFQETMLNTMQTFIEGSNSLVFSYGITGSGKTYTLQGNSENPGVIPMTMKLYFGTIEKQLMKEMVVKPHHYCDIVALSEKDRQQEQMIKNQLLSLYDEEYDSSAGSFSSYNSKSFAMSLCEFFYDSYEPEERLTTLSSDDMAASQAACQLKEMCRKCADQQPGVCSIWVSFVEIYNETIFDLLQPFTTKRTKLSLGEDKHGNVYIKGVREICVSNSEEALKILSIGRKQLSIASTKMNYQSSRSHCIFTLRVVRVPDPQNLSYGKVNRISFCDLAGSERASKTQTTGMRLKEAGAINTSLLVLGRCLEQLRMNQMGKEKRMIPFRESKLTRLFSGFFLGQGKAAIIANASPSDYSFDETLHVLKFSALAKKIMVNDTFLSNASSTLQNITNEWHTYKANSSALNDSIESVESDSDIIQKKDELIEKLLELAEEQGKELAKEKKEKAELEMKIRQQVCREYSEYSDQIIESHRLNHEAERNSVIEIYKKRIANMERMYENVIKGYKEQLKDYETDESLNESTVGNESLSELDSSDRKSLIKTPEHEFLKKDAVELPKPTCSPNLDVETLKSRLSAVSSELQNANAMLLESQNAASNLEIELSISKAENENLARKIAEYQTVESKYASITAEYENQLKDLEKKLSCARDEMSVAKEEVQLKAFRVCELETEIESYKLEVEKMKKEMDKPENDSAKMKAEITKYESAVSELELDLSSANNEIKILKSELQQKVESTTNLQNEMVVLKNEIEILKKVNAELKNMKTLSEVDAKNYKQAISELEQKLVISQQDLDAQKTMVKLLTSEVQDLKKEIDDRKRDYEQLKSLSQETSEKSEKLKLDIQKNQDKLCSLQEENTSLKNKIKFIQENEARLQSVSYLQQEIDDCKKEYEKLKSFSEETCEKYEQLKLDIQKYKKTLCSLQEENASLKNEVKSLQKNEAKLQSMSHLKEEIESLKLELEKRSKEKIKFENDNVRMKSEISKYESAVSELELDLSSANTEINTLKSKVQQKATHLAELQSELKSYHKKLAELQKHDDADSRNSESSCSPEAYKSKVRKLELELSTVCQQLEASKIHLEIKALDASDLETQIKEDRKKLEVLKKEKEKYESEKFNMLKKLKSYEAMKKELEDKFSTLIISSENDKKELLKTIEELQQSLKNFEATIQKLEDYRETLLNEKLELSTEIHTYETTRKVLEDRLALKGNELKAAREEVSSLLKEIASKTKTYEDKIHVLTKDREFFEAEKKELIASILQTHKTEKKDLEDKLASTQKDREFFEAEKRELISSILHTHKTEKKDLEDKLAFTQNELKVARQDAAEISPILSDIENKVEGYKQEIAKLKESQEISEKEKEDLRIIIIQNEEKIEELEKQLSLSNLELKNLKDELSHKNRNVQELKDQMKIVAKSLNELQRSVQVENAEKSKMSTEIASNKDKIKELEKKLSDAESELESTKKEIQEKNSKVQELENEIHIYKCEVENYSNVSKLTGEADMTYKSEVEVCKETIPTLEVNLESMKEELKFSQEKLQIQSLSCNELEAEISQLKDELDRKNLELKDALETLKELEEAFESNRSQLKETQEEKKAIEENCAFLEQKLASVTSECRSLSEKLSVADEATLPLKKQIETLESEIKVTLTLAAVLQECEIKAFCRTTDLLSKAESHQIKINDLNRQISDKECNIEDIEKALLKLQIQLKDVQASCDKKLISEKEQHEVEIQEVMKLKQLVEEENLHLKKEISNIKQLSGEEKFAMKKEISDLKQMSEEEKFELKKEISNLKELSEEEKLQVKKEPSDEKDKSKSVKMKAVKQDMKTKPEVQPKVIRKAESVSNIKSTTLKQPRDIKRAVSASNTNKELSKTSRALRHKQVKDPNFIFNSPETSDNEAEVPKRSSRKRQSEDDFEEKASAATTRASKKMKSSEESKIPATRTTKRKLQADPEQNLSPVQKMATCIGQKFKNLSESVSKLASPRMTRGKRKLYNPETSSSSSTTSSTGKTTRSRKH